MIESIKITNYMNETLTLDIDHPEKSGLAVYSVDGLSPVESDIHVSYLSTGDGGIFNSAKLQTREIKLGLVLYPNYKKEETIEDIRHKIYKYFPTKEEIKITITTDTKSVYIKGYVKFNEIQIFTKEQKADITIVCPDPYFYKSDSYQVSFAEKMGLVSFPFATDYYGLPFGYLDTAQQNPFFYKGDIRTGMTITVHFTSPVRELLIVNHNTDGVMHFDDAKISAICGSSFSYGDILTITTYVGNKSVKLKKGATTYNILNAVNKNCEWFQLIRGTNSLQFQANDGPESNPNGMNITIATKLAFEGI